METFELEGLADAFYREAGLDPSRPVGIMRLALEHPEIEVHFDPTYRGTAELCGDVIRVRSQLPRMMLAWRVAHEIGERILVRVGCASEFVEQYADNLAGALIAPRRAVHNMRALWGIDLPRFARATGSTQTIVALRLGEVLDEPLAVLIGGRVKRRGPVDALPSDRELRRLSRGAGATPVRILPLTDARNRLAVLVGRY